MAKKKRKPSKWRKQGLDKLFMYNIYTHTHIWKQCSCITRCFQIIYKNWEESLQCHMRWNKPDTNYFKVWSIIKVYMCVCVCVCVRPWKNKPEKQSVDHSYLFYGHFPHNSSYFPSFKIISKIFFHVKFFFKIMNRNGLRKQGEKASRTSFQVKGPICAKPCRNKGVWRVQA